MRKPDLRWSALHPNPSGRRLCPICPDDAVELRAEKASTHAEVGQKILTLMAFMLGVDGVASSLLLVALKVRADHTDEYLYARHWLNSLGTGALYATMIMGPWILLQQGFIGNRFVAAAVWMLLMAFPAAAAKWTVQPHPHHEET